MEETDFVEVTPDRPGQKHSSQGGCAAPGAEHTGREMVITFEDLDAQGYAMGPLPKDYAGFTWSDNAWFMTREFSSAICPGGRFGLFNAHSKDLTIRSEHLFDLKGFSLCTLWSDDAEIRVEGWEAQTRKYTTALTPKRSLFTSWSAEYHAIDRLELKTEGTHILVNPITVFF